MTNNDTILQEIHIDLKDRINNKIERKKIVLEEPCETGFTIIFEGMEEENTTVRVIKPFGKAFSMKVDITGDETSKDLDELADFFLKYLEKSIELDSLEITCFCHMLHKAYPQASQDEVFNMAVTAFQGMGIQDEFNESDSSDKKIITSNAPRPGFSKLYGIPQHRRPK